MKNYDKIHLLASECITSLCNGKWREGEEQTPGPWGACGSLWWRPLAPRPCQCGVSKVSKPFQIPKPDAHETAQEDPPTTIARHRQHESANIANTKWVSQPAQKVIMRVSYICANIFSMLKMWWFFRSSPWINPPHHNHSWYHCNSSRGALYIMFENHVRSWPLLKNPLVYERLYV